MVDNSHRLALKVIDKVGGWARVAEGVVLALRALEAHGAKNVLRTPFCRCHRTSSSVSRESPSVFSTRGLRGGTADARETYQIRCEPARAHAGTVLPPLAVL